MIDLKITKKRFLDHFYYAKWLYVFMIAGALFLFSMVFTISKPVVPKEFRVDISILGVTLQEDVKILWEEEILAMLPEDQQEVNIYAMGFGGDENSTGGISIYEIIAARMAAREDDIYIMNKELYDFLSTQGAFHEMDEMALNYVFSEEIDIEEYKYTLEDEPEIDGKKYLYGLPLDNVLGLVDLGIDPRGKVIGILIYTENYDNVAKTVDYILNQTESIYDLE